MQAKRSQAPHYTFPPSTPHSPQPYQFLDFSETYIPNLSLCQEPPQKSFWVVDFDFDLDIVEHIPLPCSNYLAFSEVYIPNLSILLDL